jgi:hypothetical protein
VRPEHRKSIRKPLRHNVWVASGKAGPAAATMSDVSQLGARLDVADPATVPERFVLLLSCNGKAQRRCRVIWRSETQVGVEFERGEESGQEFGV